MNGFFVPVFLGIPRSALNQPAAPMRPEPRTTNPEPRTSNSEP